MEEASSPEAQSSRHRGGPPPTWAGAGRRMMADQQGLEVLEEWDKDPQSISRIEKCGDLPKAPRTDSAVTFTQIVLLEEPHPTSHEITPRFLIWNQEKGSGENGREAAINRELRVWRQAISGLRAELPKIFGPKRNASDDQHGTKDRPSPGELAPQSLVEELETVSLRTTVRHIAGTALAIEETVRNARDAITQVLFPGDYLPLERMEPHYCMLIIYEQYWESIGYSRGELLGTISLAPGEELALEVKNWDRFTEKTEETLASESETRSAEKLTQRDALTTTQETARRQQSRVSHDLTVSLEKVTLKADQSFTSDFSDTVKHNTERLREDTLEAANTLKTSRKAHVEITREIGREDKTTRTIRNTNRCHTLHCHYFEVLGNYRITTRPVRVIPALLMANPQVTFHLDWVLCHEAVLRRALLDAQYLSGFEAARELKVIHTITRLQQQSRPPVFESDTPAVRSAVSQISASVRVLFASWDALLTLLRANRPGFRGAVIISFPEGVWKQCLYIAQLPQRVLQALRAFANAHEASAASALSGLLATTVPEDYQVRHSPIIASDRLIDLGLLNPREFGLVAKAGRWDLPPDDAGLVSTVAAAHQLLQPPSEVAPEESSLLDRKAQASVLFNQLLCHLEANKQHYVEAVWLEEPHEVRWNRLSKHGGPITEIQNRVLGFVGDKAAYPIRDRSRLPGLMREALDSISLTEEEEGFFTESILVTLPTPGSVMEAQLGECDACEGFIQQSRKYDLRNQAAAVEQAELEVRRRIMRLESDQPDLSDPTSKSDGVIKVQVVEDAGDGGQ